MRLAKNFKQEEIIKTLYCALVRPILGYGSEVWDPYTADNYRTLRYVFNMHF